MNTDRHNNSLDVFSESVVFDYVSGLMNEKDRVDFEELLLRSPALQAAVKSERQLRGALVALDEDRRSKTNPIGSDGIDKLFTALDELDQDAVDNEYSSPNIQSLFSSRKRLALTGIAASAVLVTVLFFSFQPTQNTSEFVLLSGDAETVEVNFDQLVKEQKVAQVWLANGLSSTQVSELFSDNGLKPISRAGAAWIVTSSKVLSLQRVAKLEALVPFKKVSLIPYNSQIGAVRY